MEERTHEQNVTMAQSNWNPNMQTQNSYRTQGLQSREVPVQNAGWNRGTQGTAQEMPWDEREKNRGTQWRGHVNSRSRNEGIQEQQISYPVAKTANHSWKNGRSSGSCVKWSECKPPSCKNIKGWKPVLYHGSQLDERNFPERDAVRTKCVGNHRTRRWNRYRKAEIYLQVEANA